MALDLDESFRKLGQKLNAAKAYNELRNQYNNLEKRAGNSFEEATDKISKPLSDAVNVVTGATNVAEKTVKRAASSVKSLFDRLLDVNNVTGKGTFKYILRLLLKTIKNIEPKVLEILLEESLNTIGCDQQQTFNATTDGIYIKVSSIDLINLLKIDPNSKAGKLIYERNPINIQDNPFSMNRELYQRIQSGQPYSLDNTQLYKGASGQNLFDIEFEPTTPAGQTGGWFKVTLSNRINGANRVFEFLSDYYGSIKIFDFRNVMANITNLLTGAISIEVSLGPGELRNANGLTLFIQRVLGLCFDNDQEINVSGVAKVSELDATDDSFFEFNEIDLRNIELKVANTLKGVVTFQDCDNVELPVDTVNILNGLENLFFVEDDKVDEEAEKLPGIISNNPEWSKLAFTGNIKTAVDLDFIKLTIHGLIFTILSPKVLLPIFIMVKALGQTAIDFINDAKQFIKIYKRFFLNLVSRIGAIFVQELFELIKKDIKNLIQQIINDISKEKIDKRIIMILKLIQVLLVISQLISDWRKCKSVVDELLYLLTIATKGFGNDIPLPLLYGAQLLDGYSESRAFTGVIEELQKLGIPTGDMPDGSPNLGILSIFSQFKAQANELAENGKVAIGLPPLAVSPPGVLVPWTVYGKSI
jgi:hypothetical protein